MNATLWKEQIEILSTKIYTSYINPLIDWLDKEIKEDTQNVPFDQFGVTTIHKLIMNLYEGLNFTARERVQLYDEIHLIFVKTQYYLEHRYDIKGKTEFQIHVKTIMVDRVKKIKQYLGEKKKEVRKSLVKELTYERELKKRNETWVALQHSKTPESFQPNFTNSNHIEGAIYLFDYSYLSLLFDRQKLKPFEKIKHLNAALLSWDQRAVYVEDKGENSKYYLVDEAWRIKENFGKKCKLLLDHLLLENSASDSIDTVHKGVIKESITSVTNKIIWKKDVKELAYLFYVLRSESMLTSPFLAKDISEMFITEDGTPINNKILNKYFSEFARESKFPAEALKIEKIIKKSKQV